MYPIPSYIIIWSVCCGSPQKWRFHNPHCNQGWRLTYKLYNWFTGFIYGIIIYSQQSRFSVKKRSFERSMNHSLPARGTWTTSYSHCWAMSPTLGPLHNWCSVKWRGSWRYPPRLWSRQLLVRRQRPCSASWSTRPQPTATFASGCICLVKHTGNGYGRLQTGSLPLKNESFTVSLPTVTELWQPPMYRISDCSDTKNWMLAQIEDQWIWWICHLVSKPNHATGRTIANSPDTPQETYTKTEDHPLVKGKSSTNHPSFLGVLFLFSGHVFFANVYIIIYYHFESLYAQPTNLLFFLWNA